MFTVIKEIQPKKRKKSTTTHHPEQNRENSTSHLKTLHFTKLSQNCQIKFHDCFTSGSSLHSTHKFVNHCTHFHDHFSCSFNFIRPKSIHSLQQAHFDLMTDNNNYNKINEPTLLPRHIVLLSLLHVLLFSFFGIVSRNG
jgi:hypothetical protein